MALCFCIERAYVLLQEQGQGGRLTHIVVERRGRREDAELELAFRRILGGANRWGKLTCFELVFADKRTNSAGLQLADLTARPLGRHVLAPTQPNHAYEIIEKKLRRSPTGEVFGRGLKVFPETT